MSGHSTAYLVEEMGYNHLYRYQK